MPSTSSQEVIRVVIADGDAIALRTLTELFSTQPRVHIAATCRSAAEVVHEVMRTAAQVLVIAARIGGASGVDAALAARRERAGLRIVLLATELSPSTAQGLAGLGIDETLTRGAALTQLVPLVCGTSSASLDHTPLSLREQAVAELLVVGMSNREIGEQLGVSVNSIKTFTNRIYKKVGVANRVQLTRAWRT